MVLLWSFLCSRFYCLTCGKKRKKEKEKEKGRREKGNRKGKEGSKEEGIKKERRTERNKEVRGKGGEKKSSAGFIWVRLVLLVVLSVERQGLFGGIGFTFLPS